MPIVHVSQAVVTQQIDDLFQVTIFGDGEVLDNIKTPHPEDIIERLRYGELTATFDRTILFQLAPVRPK